jgi:hypothetical protein
MQIWSEHLGLNAGSDSGEISKIQDGKGRTLSVLVFWLISVNFLAR